MGSAVTGFLLPPKNLLINALVTGNCILVCGGPCDGLVSLSGVYSCLMLGVPQGRFQIHQDPDQNKKVTKGE